MLGGRLRAYHAKYGRFPESLAGDPMFLEILRDQRPIPEHPLADAWRHPYRYAAVGVGFKLWSVGPDGVSDTADDVPCPPESD
jgi:hypothetical protein